MARYRFGPKEGPYSDPHRLGPTMGLVHKATQRDGPEFRFRSAAGLLSRFYRRAPLFWLRVRYGLSVAKPGTLMHVITKASPGEGPGKIYFVTKEPRPKPANERAVAFALSELGTPYRFGAANGPDDVGADTFDCSGLTMTAWQEATNENTQLPHSANAQRDSALVSLFFDAKRLAPGDLVFFNFPNTRGIYPPNASHVGLFYKDGRVIDTRSTSEPVAIRAIEWGSTVGFGRVRH